MSSCPERAATVKPYSLVRRLTALVLMVSVVALAFNAALFVSSLHDVGRDMVDKWASEVHIVVAALRATPAADRARMARTLSVGEVSVTALPPPAASEPTWAQHHLPPALRQAFEASLGQGIALVEASGATGPARTYLVARIGDEHWWIGYPTPGPPVSQLIIVPLAILALIGLSTVITLFIGLRLITRPMSQLADDMLARSSDLRPIDMPRRVSAELEKIIRAFNALVSDLRVTDQMRRHLLAGVSHDLRTPLARLKLRAELHGSDQLYEAMAQDIGAALTIVDQFMHHAQGRGHELEGWQQPAASVLRQTVQQYQELSLPVSLTRLDEGAQPVNALNIQRVLGNLIDNALAHGCPPVELALHERTGGIELWVCDHGPGFARHELARATQPFVKLGEPGGKPGHFGLGLSIVDQIARKLGGALLLRPFDGQCFGVGIWLPDARAAQGMAAAATPVKPDTAHAAAPAAPAAG
jgi:two-component system osmolarity sensor histidine kinase EnvZ